MIILLGPQWPATEYEWVDAMLGFEFRHDEEINLLRNVLVLVLRHGPGI